MSQYEETLLSILKNGYKYIILNKRKNIVRSFN